MKIASILALVILASANLQAKVSLPSVLADHMVLQREKPIPLWGWTDPGETVTVAFAGQTKTAIADAHGKWMVELDPMPANAESREMVVSDQDSKVNVSDVLVGEVWLAGGQSNMGFPLATANNAAEALPKAQDSQLRFFLVETKTAAEPQTNCVGKWEESTPAAARDFSAVAYFFAREIRADQKCPVAVLQSPWGGTDIETWISLAGLKMPPPLTKTLDRWDKAAEEYKKVQANPSLVADYEKTWKEWEANVAPGYNAALKQYNQDREAGKPAEPPKPSQPEPSNPNPMGMPSPDRRPNTPTVNFNAMIAPLIPYEVRGVIWYQGENNGSRGLEYRDLFPRLIEDWRNQWREAGNEADAELPFLFVQLPCNGPDNTPVAESGWPWLREAQLMTLQKIPRTGMAVTIDIGNPRNVHPKDKIDVGHRLALLARKLVYGENVVASGPLFQNFKIEGNQVRVTFADTGSGLTIGQQPWCAPGVKLFPKDKLIGFCLAGADKMWFTANATIDADSVVLSSPQVPHPAAVRYGWANSPRCNLYNKERLPASPFRTDDWPK